MTAPAITKWAAAAAAALAIVTAGIAVAGQMQQEFPHEEHAGLFPLCEGCHRGVPTGDRAAFYPEPAQCAGCHDGVAQPRAEWTGRVDVPDNIVFEHAEHPIVDAQGAAIDCTTCHTTAGAPRMAVEDQPVVPRCLDCHEHRAESHFIDADCTTCHVPLADAPFDRARILALPVPDDHAGTDFILLGHGAQASADAERCAVCHTRELCSSCHVNAAGVDAIGSVPAAAGIVAAELPPVDVQYPKPASHASPDFLEEHGARASGASCSTCHTQDSCLTCHVGTVPAVVMELPAGSEVVAPGVPAVRRMPTSHSAPGFTFDHGNVAAAAGSSCMSCHQRTMCTDCHGSAAAEAGETATAAHPSTARPGAAPGAFHPLNYMARHSAEAYGRRLECSNCHDSRVFCADCHASAGMSPGRTGGRLGTGFHDAEPLWLLRHGQAARQGLESCASCHEQNQCMQCHSTLGAFKVSPHGPDFDARRAQKRNAAICLACHITDPLTGRT
jgi:hypothetical protein